MATEATTEKATAQAAAAKGPPRALNQEQLDSFWKQGYLRWGKILQDSEIELLRREYDAIFVKALAENTFRNLAISDTPDLAAKKAAPAQMLQVMQMCERSIEFRRLLYDARFLDIVQEIIGPNIQLFHDQALFKPARHGAPVYWHQDNAYWKCIPANLVSCWLTLDDVDVHNGAMHVIPGSHLSPVWHQTAKTTSALLELEVDESKAVVNDLPAGGCMFHHCQTLHYTRPNTTERQRRAFVMHYMPPGTRSGHSGQIIKVSFHNPMLRASLG